MGRRERGDWQTPPELARAVLGVVGRGLPQAPAVVVEPTCGEGAFLVAAAEAFPRARLVGYELDEAYAAAARARLGRRGEVRVADAFRVDWARELGALRGPLLVVGNPPWVTSATLGALGSSRAPAKRNEAARRGIDAVTGASNFDVSEWLLLRWLEALAARRATVAMLCKTAVARRVIERLASSERADVRGVGLWRIDAKRAFDAAVDAVLLVCETGHRPSKPPAARWPLFDALDARAPRTAMAVVDGALVADAEAHARTAHLAGASDPAWRSGVKHDCADVMELARDGRAWRNGLGERVAIEPSLVYPMLKGSDVANGRTTPSRAVVLPQRALGDDTTTLRARAPRGWAYLSAHEGRLGARKSRVYAGRAPFAVFGVGPYTFAPWKVAVAGLYKRCAFALVPPHEGRPVVLDDTCYFLPFDREPDARRAHAALASNEAREFLEARVFWDAKRPLSKALLQRLDWRRLTAGR